MSDTTTDVGRRVSWPQRWAIVVFVGVTALYVAGFALTLMAGEPITLNELLLPVVYSFAVVGFLIALRRPRNSVAWICLGIGLVWGLEAALWGAALYGLAHPGTVTSPEALAAFAGPMWIPGIIVILTFLLLLFPDGRLPSRRWRWLAWLVGIGITLSYVAAVLAEPVTYSYGRPGIENPFAGVLGNIVDEGGPAFVALELFLVGTGVVGIPAALTALVRRYRRSTGIERHQLKWLAAAGTASGAIYVTAVILVDVLGDTVGLVAAFAFVFIPVSIGIAVLRYRLYEIDRLVSRTVTYGLVIGVLAAVYAGVAIGIPQVLPLPMDTPLVVAAATLTAAALFNPVRRQVQAGVDRRFNRARYDAQLEVDRLADWLRTDFELDDLTDEVLHVVSVAMQPASASVWIRGDAQ